MNIQRFVPFFLSLLLLAGFSSDVAAQKVLLRLDLEKGDTFSYVNTSEQTITQDIMGMNQVIEQTIGMYYDVEVLEKTGDQYILNYTYTRTTLDMDGGPMMGTTTYDSDNADEEEVSPNAMGYAALVGQSFQVTMSSRGEVVDLTGVDEMLDNMMDQMEGLSAVEKEAVRTSMKTQFGTKTMKSSLQNSSPIFPEKKVKVGKEWAQSGTSSAGFTINMETTFTLESVSNDSYVLASTVAQTSDPEKPMEMNGMTLAYDLTGNGTGKQTLDPATCMIREYVFDQKLEGDVNASGGMMGSGMEWPISIVSKTTLKMVSE